MMGLSATSVPNTSDSLLLLRSNSRCQGIPRADPPQRSHSRAKVPQRPEVLERTWAASSGRGPQGEARVKLFERFSRALEHGQAVDLNLEVTLCLAATFCRGFADPRRSQALAFETFEGLVDGTDGRRTTRNVLDFSAYHPTIRPVSKAENCQQNNVLELSEVLALAHIVDIVDNIGVAVNLGDGCESEA